MKWQQLVGNKSGRYKWYFPESWVILTPAHSETEAPPLLSLIAQLIFSKFGMLTAADARSCRGIQGDDYLLR